MCFDCFNFFVCLTVLNVLRFKRFNIFAFWFFFTFLPNDCFFFILLGFDCVKNFVFWLLKKCVWTVYIVLCFDHLLRFWRFRKFRKFWKFWNIGKYGEIWNFGNFGKFGKLGKLGNFAKFGSCCCWCVSCFSCFSFFSCFSCFSCYNCCWPCWDLPDLRCLNMVWLSVSESVTTISSWDACASKKVHIDKILNHCNKTIRIDGRPSKSNFLCRQFFWLKILRRGIGLKCPKNHVKI